jgi:hypothetical protein
MGGEEKRALQVESPTSFSGKEYILGHYFFELVNNRLSRFNSFKSPLRDNRG